MSPDPNDAVIMESTFDLEEHSVFRTRLRLYADRLTLSAWTWRGRFRRRIRLSNIDEAQATAENQLELTVQTGSRLRLTLPEAHRWQFAIVANQICLSDS